jgi:hypothetical protein
MVGIGFAIRLTWIKIARALPQHSFLRVVTAVRNVANAFDLYDEEFLYNICNTPRSTLSRAGGRDRLRAALALDQKIVRATRRRAASTP